MSQDTLHFNVKFCHFHLKIGRPPLWTGHIHFVNENVEYVTFEWNSSVELDASGTRAGPMISRVFQVNWWRHLGLTKPKFHQFKVSRWQSILLAALNKDKQTKMLILTLKGVCGEIFTVYFSWFEPIWAPDKQAKVFSNHTADPKWTQRSKNRTFRWSLVRFFKGQSEEILLGVNTSIIKEKISRIKSGFRKFKILTPRSKIFLIFVKSKPNSKIL